MVAPGYRDRTERRPGCARPDRPSILAYATLLLSAGTWLLLQAIVNRQSIEWSRPLAFLWVGTIGAVLGFYPYVRYALGQDRAVGIVTS